MLGKATTYTSDFIESGFMLCKISSQWTHSQQLAVERLACAAECVLTHVTCNAISCKLEDRRNSGHKALETTISDCHVDGAADLLCS